MQLINILKDKNMTNIIKDLAIEWYKQKSKYNRLLNLDSQLKIITDEKIIDSLNKEKNSEVFKSLFGFYTTTKKQKLLLDLHKHDIVKTTDSTSVLRNIIYDMNLQKVRIKDNLKNEKYDKFFVKFILIILLLINPLIVLLDIFGYHMSKPIGLIFLGLLLFSIISLPTVINKLMEDSDKKRINTDLINFQYFPNTEQPHPHH